ncbi:MlaD family protein [Lutibacter flavus]|uniref:Phospholipid/cholesterol/gamma-HCH transport system substrate-binding protein n=1 Tax=Lutibacter flavus TaxID=691689 RepID=A0A238VFE6_9FLAO|nr:MlaD family protein [Lutibacter flavus]SNR32807.1 phospholipid/cholesterol/gamma-HCH transport system substrate-binding protein [Lutibacter flavus]
MKKSNSQKINLGLFVIISTLFLIIALYFIGNRQNLFSKNFKISAVFNNVNGLILGNNVRYSGINVGTVKNINMINDTTICVDMLIDEKILKHIKQNAVAGISSDGLVGSMVINIAPEKDYAPPLIPGDTIKSYSKISTNDMLETLNTTNDNISLLTSDLLKITTSIKTGDGTLGMLINDPELAYNLKKTVANLKTASISASNSLLEFNKIIKTINFDESMAGVLLSDSISAIQMKSIITNLDKSSIGIDSVISNINDLVLNVKNGEGTLDYMVNDTVLVNNIDETVKNIKEGSIRLNENLEALKHNFLFRGYFRKLERQKAKEAKKNN